MISRVRQSVGLLTGVLLAATLASAQPNFETAPIPAQLIGRWKITRILPTRNVTCFDEKQARVLLGKELQFEGDHLTYEHETRYNRRATVETLTADDFLQSSGHGHYYADFRQLGIAAPAVQQITLLLDGRPEHQPGDSVLIKSHEKIIVSACNVFYEARRLAER